MAETRSRTYRRIAALVVMAYAAVLLFAPLPVGWQTGWRAKLLDFGHVPLFAVLVVALRGGLGLRLGWSVVVAVAAAGLVEVIQPAVGRTGDWGDFIHGTLGALAGAAVVRAIECRHRRARAVGCLVLAAGLVAWPVVEVVPYLADAVEAHQAFPVLAGFETDRELLRWECRQAELTRIPYRPGGWVGRLDLFPGPHDYPSAALRPVVGDFRGYRSLCCGFRVVGDPLELVISVRSGTPDRHRTTHAQVGRTYAAGDHVVRLDLAALVAAAEEPDPLDLSDVRYVQFFAVRPTATRTVFLLLVWLEP
jgi:hypothetical protein